MLALEEVAYAGNLADFTKSQQMQIGKWLAYEANISNDPGIIGSAQRVVAAAMRGSAFPVVEAYVTGMIDNQIGIVCGGEISEARLDEQVAGAMLLNGGITLFDNSFTVYGDGSIMVGYKHTGFMLDFDTFTVIHPASRFSFQLTEESYDLSHGQQCQISGRTLFFYRLAQACKSKLTAKEKP